MEEIDIYRTAKIMVEQYGANANIEAQARVQKFLLVSNIDAARTWKRIADAIEFLQIDKLPLLNDCH